MQQRKKLVLIDAMSILHRAYHAYPPSLTTPKGDQINAVYGFANILLTVLEKLKPTHVAVAWDVGEKTFRHEEYERYKERREKPDEALLNQIDRTRELVEVLNMPQFGVAGFEADDLIGSLSRQAVKDKQAEVVIVTGDRDALQLVKEDRVVVYMPSPPGRYGKDKGPSIYDEAAVEVKYQMTPRQLIDLKALMGDASDDIPGISGVGGVTATKLVKAFGDLEGIYQQLEKDRDKVVAVVGERLTKLLEEGKESAFLSHRLGTIEIKAPIRLKWEKCRLADYDRDRALKLFEELAFKSLAKKLPRDKWEESLEEVFR